jgi:hypothetical protein
MGGREVREGETHFCLWRTKAKNISLEESTRVVATELQVRGRQREPQILASRTSRPPILPVKNLEPLKAARIRHGSFCESSCVAAALARSVFGRGEALLDGFEVGGDLGVALAERFDAAHGAHHGGVIAVTEGAA